MLKVALQALTLPYIRGTLSRIKHTQVLASLPQRIETLTKIQSLAESGVIKTWTPAPQSDWTCLKLLEDHSLPKALSQS